MEKKFIKRFAICSLALAIVFIGIVVVFDPFFHYHDAISPLKRVLEERDYQVAGTLDNFDYDAVILGNSLAENFNNAWFDETFDVKSIKAVKAAGNNSNLLYYLDRAFDSHEIKQVYYTMNMDMFMFDTQVTYKSEDYYYMVNNNPIDDIKYVMNKDVLLKKIPIMLAYSLVLDYDEGESYNWYSTKNFSAEAVTSFYYPYDNFDEDKPLDENIVNLDANIELLKAELSAHPNTQFYIVFPPVSILWWDNEYRIGRLNQKLFEFEYFCNALLEYDNVHLYATFADEDIVCNLNNYMDTVHYNQNISHEIVNQMSEGDNLITKENVSSYSNHIKEVTIEFSNNGILDYYPDAVVQKGND